MSTNITLRDFQPFDKTTGIGELFNLVAQRHPEVRTGVSKKIAGSSYFGLCLTKLPTVGFRQVNAGAARTKPEFEVREVQTYIIDATIAIDEQAMGEKVSPQEYLSRTATTMVEASIRTLCNQFYYGGLGNHGFEGLINDNKILIDKNKASSSDSTSIYAVRWGTDGVRWIFGKNGTIGTRSIFRQEVLDSSNRPYQALILPITFQVGLQLIDPLSWGRIEKVNETTTTTADKVTDADFYKLLAKFPADKKPNAFYCRPAVVEQLRSTRTAYSPTGQPAPRPESVAGIPIYETDSIKRKE